MKESIEFLRYIFQDALISLKTIEKLSHLTNHHETLEYLREQISAYKSIGEEAEKLLLAAGVPISAIAELGRFSCTLHPCLQVVRQRSSKPVTEMMAGRSLAKISELENALLKYSSSPEPVWNLAETLLALEKGNLEYCNRMYESYELNTYPRKVI